MFSCSPFFVRFQFLFFSRGIIKNLCLFQGLQIADAVRRLMFWTIIIIFWFFLRRLKLIKHVFIFFQWFLIWFFLLLFGLMVNMGLQIFKLRFSLHIYNFAVTVVSMILSSYFSTLPFLWFSTFIFGFITSSQWIWYRIFLMQFQVHHKCQIFTIIYVLLVQLYGILIFTSWKIVDHFRQLL